VRVEATEMIKQGEENKRIEKSPTEELSRWGRFKNPHRKTMQQ